MSRITVEEIGEYYNQSLAIEEASFLEAVKPEVQKEPPLFSTQFVSNLLGVSRTYLYSIINQYEDDLDVRLIGKNTKKITPLGIYQIRQILDEKSPEKHRLNHYKRAFVVGVNSNKGGTGKTQTTYNLGAYLSLQGKRVLLLDFDAQSTLTSQVGIPEVFDESLTSYSLATPYEDGVPSPSELICKTNWHNLDIIPSSLGLYGVEFEIPVERINDPTFEFWNILNTRLESIRDKYDIILIDSAPSLSFASMNIVYASDGLLMPTLPSQSSFHSLISYLRMLSSNLEAINQGVKDIGGKEKTFDFMKVVINMFEDSSVSKHIVRKLQFLFGENVLLTPILRSKSVEQAVSEYKNIYEIIPKSRETHSRCMDSYNNFGKEILDSIDEIKKEEFELE